MSVGPAEIIGIITACGVALGALTKPLFRWLTAKALVKCARPEDIPEIAKALRPQIELRRNPPPGREVSKGGGTSPIG